MIVYCNGDSFVAGVELADYMLPEYPGCVPFHHDQETSDRNLKWIRKTYDMSHEFGLIRKKKKYSLAIEEKNRAWPNKLKTLLELVLIFKEINIQNENNFFYYLKSNAIKREKRSMENISRNGKYKYGLIKKAEIVTDIDDKEICPK